MNCPLCAVALKLASYRGLHVNYCPLCGGTWLGSSDFASASTPGSIPRRYLPFSGRPLIIVSLSLLLMAGCLVAAFSIVAVKAWPAFRSWAGTVLIANKSVLPASMQELPNLIGATQMQTLAQMIRNTKGIPDLAGSPAFERLLRSMLVIPGLARSVQDGAYERVLQEAVRQNVPTLSALKMEAIGLPDVRAAAGQFQALMLSNSEAAAVLEPVDPAVLEILRNGAFQRLCRSPAFESLLGSGGGKK
jgi:Transcription factor zinc-finger